MNAPSTHLRARLGKRFDWHELPTPLAIVKLMEFRNELRAHNLHDTYRAGGEEPRRPTPQRPSHRSYDGSGYDPSDEDMGRSGTRFDRNAPPDMTLPDPSLLSPNPREISNRLLVRDSFRPATTVNALAAAWIQFQNHDWFNHGQNHVDDPIEIDLPAGDDWSQDPILVRRSRLDPTAHTTSDAPPTYENIMSHWWDGAQIYGSTEERNRRLRTGEDGKMIVENGLLPLDSEADCPGIDLTGFSDNYWAGLSMLHTLFVKEHNAICDHLRQSYPNWDDEIAFHVARLVNTAVMAKIHTIEWTPALLAHPAVQFAMNANWQGVAGAVLGRRIPRLTGKELLGGILGSRMDHHGAPFSITEEFVACYRMHPLIADDWQIRSHLRGQLIEDLEFNTLLGHNTRDAVIHYGFSDLFYSFGVAHPGSITLHNHPNALRNLTRTTGEHVDLGAVDILRDRERGIPRYNDFRRMLRKRPAQTFDELTDNPTWASELEDVYDGDLEQVDLMVGNYAEPLPRGFAFSDTAFRIFILMASRRLKSDPFFTDLYDPRIYTPEGLAWIERTGMLRVLHRHHPELAPALAGVRNAFVPWRRLT